MITLASRCQGNCRHQLSQCSGKRRVNQITPGTIASHVIPLDNSQTAGSHAATSRSDRRTSMNMVMALATPLTMVTRTQKPTRSEEHPSELQSLMRLPYAVFCWKKKRKKKKQQNQRTNDE